jgi:hypothetical protein
MSNNTQEQGRSILTERSFTFTPTPGEDLFRTLNRFEIELQRQLYVGDVTHDAAAKQAVMDSMQPPPVETTPPATTPDPAPTTPAST